MKRKISIKNNIMNVKFLRQPKEYVTARLLEMGFTRVSGREFSRTNPICQNEHDYLNGLLGVTTGLGAVYVPASEKGYILDTVVPDSMGQEMHIAVRKIKKAVGGSFLDYLCDKLDYDLEGLLKALSCEQMDAVSLAIYNIEKRKQGVIIGDQTGIGKGRIAAAMIRYGVKRGKQPIFISEKPNLFSDLYRDMVDIDSGDLVPFVVNKRDATTHIQDKDGNVVFKAPASATQLAILKAKKVSEDYDYICATYSQFNSIKDTVKRPFLHKLAKNNILVMDEAHNASGASQTGAFMKSVLMECKGVTFLSATFAKRADNMPIYAMKTAMSEANLSDEGLVNAILTGGVALQEVLAAQLVLEGQMVRRERGFDGIEVNYIELKEKEKEHKEIADRITAIIRRIIAFQEDHIKKVIKDLDKVAAAEGEQVEERKGTSKAGCDNAPYFSKVFNVINQMLFSINASDVADYAIKLLKEGKKPIIAFSSTMGSFLEDMGEPDDIINADFAAVLKRGLEGTLRYTIKDVAGDSSYSRITLNELSLEGQAEYREVMDMIRTASTGISISPIDVIKQKIVEAGFSCGEVTGRKLAVVYGDFEISNKKNNLLKGSASLATNKAKKQKKSVTTTAQIIIRNKENTVGVFREFNNNRVDALLINQSGSTGASAHAVVTDAVPLKDVKQRVMLVLQAEFDISIEIQKRGRINRTGQVLLPEYDYIISTIPAQRRFLMMLKNKLKSLDANTASNQKNSDRQLESDDFLNKYGDRVVYDYLFERPMLSKSLDDPLNILSDDKDVIIDGAASKVTGRVAVLPVKDQEVFYKEVLQQYEIYVNLVKQKGEYDIEVETLDLKANTLESKTLIGGKGGASAFGRDTILERCECNVLRKPYTKKLLDVELKKAKVSNADKIQQDIIKRFESYVKQSLEQMLLKTDKKYDDLLSTVTNEAGFKKATSKSKYIEQRQQEIEEGRDLALKLAVKNSKNNKEYLIRFLKFFKVGRNCKFPTVGDFSGSYTPSICLGVEINKKAKNPFAPSSVNIRFAVGDSRKMMLLPCSGESGVLLDRIIGLSFDFNYSSFSKEWTYLVAKYSVSRSIRYIITGNILQASDNYQGKLVSYTTKNGRVAKGILMPTSWSPMSDENKSDANVIIPIANAVKHIVSTPLGNTVGTNNEITLVRYSIDAFQVIMPKRKTHIPIYTDKDICKCLENSRDGFEMVSGMMKAKVPLSKMEKFIKLLGDRFSVSLSISRAIYDRVFTKGKERKSATEDQLTKEALEMFRIDEKNFSQKLRKQKNKIDDERQGRKRKTQVITDKMIKINEKNYIELTKDIDFSKEGKGLQYGHKRFADLVASSEDDNNNICNEVLDNHFRAVERLLNSKSPKPVSKRKALAQKSKSKLTKPKQAARKSKEVVVIPIEIRFMKRYLNMNDERVSERQVILFYRAMQKAATEKAIHKNSEHAHIIEAIGEDLSCTYKEMEGDAVKFVIPQKLKKQIEKIVGDYGVKPSVALIKRFINLYGGVTPDKARRLLTSIKNAKKNGKVQKTDSTYAKIVEIESHLGDYLKSDRLVITDIQLNGFKGIAGVKK